MPRDMNIHKQRVITFRLPADFKSSEVLLSFIVKFEKFLRQINDLTRTRTDSRLTLKMGLIDGFRIILRPDGFTFQKMIEHSFEDLSIRDALETLFENSNRLNPSAMARLIFRTMWNLTRDYAIERKEMNKLLERIPIL